jgi:CRISPR-associated protein Cmr4
MVRAVRAAGPRAQRPERRNEDQQEPLYEEALPPDTLLSLVVGERADSGAAGDLAAFLAERRYLQVGGNETVGQGWFTVQRLAAEAGQ